MTVPVATSAPTTGTAPEDTPKVRHPDTAMYRDDRRACRDLALGTRAIHDDLLTYLPKHEAEKPDDHRKRGLFTEVYNGFGRTIGAVAGLVFQKPPKLGDDVPAVMREHYEAIDSNGTHGDVFLRDSFADGLVNGYGGILVEYPKVPENAEGRRLSIAEERARRLRPFWSYVTAEDIWVWRTAERGRERYLTMLVLSETRTVEKGLFGVGTEQVFRVYRHDLENDRITVEVWAERGATGERRLQIIEEASPIIGPSRIPFAPFQMGAGHGLIVARPPLLDLADLNLAHYRVSADRRWLMHLCCVPVPWARGLMMNPDGSEPALQIGPNVAVLLTEQGAFGWAEPAGSAFVPTGEELDRLENRMAALGLAFLQRDTRQAETAEARRLDSASQNSTVADAARRFEDAVETALRFHAEFAGVALTKGGVPSGGSFTLNRDYETTVLSDSTLSILSGMQEKGQLTLETLWKLMENGRVLPEGFDPEAEKEKLDLEKDVPDATDDPDPAEDV